MTTTAHRIAIDLNPLLPDGQNGGAASATLDLVAGFAAHGRQVLLLVEASNASAVDHLLGPGIERYVVRKDSIVPRRTVLGDEWPPPWTLSRALGADVLFCPFGDPFWAEDAVPTVCTINDLQHLDHPEYFTADQLAHRAEYLERVVGVASHVVVPTAYTERSVRSHLGSGLAVSVVPYANRLPGLLGGAERPGEAPSAPYLLYPANAWPHKNHSRLLEAMAIHRRRCVASGREPVRLVCTGALLDRRRHLDRQRFDLDLVGHVDLLGHVPDPQLLDLYCDARGLIFPSLYEGFGLPVLEAMAAGIPVACSDVASLPEVAGDAAHRFDPTDTDAIADAIDLLAFDDGARATLLERAPARLEAFTPARTVDRLLAVLDGVVTAARPAPGPRPSISVVMPSFQQQAFIGRSIASVIDQGEVVAEFVVCDGGSTDGTVEVLERHADVLGFVSEPDGGQAAAINKGIAISSGEVIAWLNSDDVYYPHALDAVATVFAHHPDLQWAYFAADHIDVDGARIEPYYNRPWDPAAFRDSCYICQPGAFFRAAFVREVGGLDESLRYCMDYELWFRMAELRRPTYIPIVTAGSRLHEDTKTLGQRTFVLQETVDMLARTHGRTSQWWLLGQIGDRVDAARTWELSDPAESRRRHRFALRVAAATFARNRSFPEPATRRILAGWARESIGRPAPRFGPPRQQSLQARIGGRLSPGARRALSAPYHEATRWVRRRTIFELEPRLEELEKGVVAGHRAIEELRTRVRALDGMGTTATTGNAAVELERVVFAHHQVEEALLERVTSELADIRAELDQLRGRQPDG